MAEWFLSIKLQKASGESGYRSRYLSHAKRALYHFELIPPPLMCLLRECWLMRWTKAALVLTVVMPVLDSLSTFGGITKQSSHFPTIATTTILLLWVLFINSLGNMSCMIRWFSISCLPLSVCLSLSLSLSLSVTHTGRCVRTACAQEKIMISERTQEVYQGECQSGKSYSLPMWKLRQDEAATLRAHQSMVNLMLIRHILTDDNYYTKIMTIVMGAFQTIFYWASAHDATVSYWWVYIPTVNI